MKVSFRTFRRSRAAARLVLIGCVAGALGLGSAALAAVPRLDASGTVAYFPGHCKNANHLAVRLAPDGSPLVGADAVAIEVQQATDSLECANDPGYRGPIYTIVINGKPTMNMEPSGAQLVEQAFVGFGPGVALEIDHTVAGSFSTFRCFDVAAVAKIAAELAGA
jgi:hypothetical protein